MPGHQHRPDLGPDFRFRFQLPDAAVVVGVVEDQLLAGVDRNQTRNSHPVRFGRKVLAQELHRAVA